MTSEVIEAGKDQIGHRGQKRIFEGREDGRRT